MSISKLKLVSSNLYQMVLALFAITGLASCGGGAIAASATTNSSSAVVSRTSGVAPLAVFFDATGTTSAVTKKPFSDLQYTWNFGDPAGSPASSTTWGQGSQVVTATCTGAAMGCRNVAYGAVAAHVYENTGIFTPTLIIFDGVSSVSVNMPSIKVSAVAAANTYCISVAGSFTGCPAGATHVTIGAGTSSTPFSYALTNYATSSKCNGTTPCAILFHSGETYAAGTGGYLMIAGPGVIGSYDTGAKPLIEPASTGTGVVIQPAATDWRVMDLEINGLDQSGAAGVISQGGSSQLTLLRVYAHDAGSGINLGGSQIFLVDSQINNIGSSASGDTYASFSSLYQSAFLGNKIQFSGNGSGNAGHTVRFPFLAKSVVSENYIGDAGQSGGGGDLAIKLHGPTWCAGSGCNYLTDTCGTLNYGAGPCNSFPDSYSELDVISDNELTGPVVAGPYIVVIGPENNTTDERLKNIVVERNWFKVGTAGGIQNELVLHGVDITARNNIFNMTGAGQYRDAVAVSTYGVEPPNDNNEIYNNTMYASDNFAATFYIVGFNNTGTNVSVINNIAYSPYASTTAVGVADGAPISYYLVSNNSTAAEITGTSPKFVIATPVNPADFKIGGTSYAIGTGLTLNLSTSSPYFPGLWLDFFGVARAAHYDMGAINH